MIQESDKKYIILEDETIVHNGHTLYRIQALKDFSNVKKDSKGGWISGYHNLSQQGDCWIYNEAKVYELALVFEDACISNYAEIYGNAQVFNEAKVWGNPKDYDPESLDNYYKDAKRCTDYIFNKAKLFINTNEEINNLIKERYGEGQDDPDNINNYWCNGEIFILRIVDNKVTYTIR